jgi:hypothetical protein
MDLEPASFTLGGSPNKRDSMSEAVTAYAYRVGEAVAAYILDPALLSVTLLVAAFWMLWVLVALSIIKD